MTMPGWTKITLLDITKLGRIAHCYGTPAAQKPVSKVWTAQECDLMEPMDEPPSLVVVLLTAKSMNKQKRFKKNLPFLSATMCLARHSPL